MRFPWRRACSLLFRRSGHVSRETLKGSVGRQTRKAQEDVRKQNAEGMGRGTRKGRYLVEMVCLFAVLAIPFSQWL